MADVLVRALRAFEYRGRAFRHGQHLDMAPVDAAIAARAQRVSLSVERGTVADPPDEPTRRSRRYRRRDMVAESVGED